MLCISNMQETKPLADVEFPTLYRFVCNEEAALNRERLLRRFRFPHSMGGNLMEASSIIGVIQEGFV